MKKVFSFENSYGDVLKGHVRECENFKKNCNYCYWNARTKKIKRPSLL